PANDREDSDFAGNDGDGLRQAASLNQARRSARSAGNILTTESKTSLQVFRDFLYVPVRTSTGSVELRLDASRVFSLSCFDAWSARRDKPIGDSLSMDGNRKRFQAWRRALVCHLTGSD